MAFAVALPKTVAMQNQRLTALHFSMVFSLLFTLIYTKVVVSHEHLGVVSIQSNLEMKWDEMASIAGMEDFLLANPDVQYQCELGARTRNASRMRWGHNWPRIYVCARLCNLNEYLSHETWNGRMSSAQQKRAACWSSFKAFGIGMRYTALQFMESQGSRDVAIITSKNDWLVNHTAHAKTGFLELVPQSRGAVLEFGYTYELLGRPPRFPGSSQHRAVWGGDKHARTLILDAEGKPVSDPIPPGDSIKLSLDELWHYAKPADGEERQPLDKDVLGTGAEVLAMSACFGDDRHLLEHITEQQPDGDPEPKEYGASLEDPVCVIRFKVESTNYQIHASFGAPMESHGDFSQEVLSETRGISIKSMQVTSLSEIWDWNTLLLQITSLLVLLGMPMKITALIATRMLGPLSRMYKRILVEPYCIEEVAAMTSTVLAQNVASFYQLSNEDEDGASTIKLHAIQMLVRRAFEAELSEAELQALASFLYKDITKVQRLHSDTRVSHLGWLFDIEFGNAKQDGPTRNGITLDQWNSCRLNCEKITFEALVKLFDKDRPRSLVERIFTPSRITAALESAMTPEDRARSYFPGLQSSQPLSEPTEPRENPTLRRSGSLGRKSEKCMETVHLPSELIELMERVQVLEEDMKERGRVANEDRERPGMCHPAEPWLLSQPEQPAPASAPHSHRAARAPGQLEAEFPPGTQPAPPLLESWELQQALTCTLPALAEKVAALESSVSRLAGDVAGLNGTASKCGVCDGFWPKAILKELPLEVMQDLDDVRGDMEELERRFAHEKSLGKQVQHERSRSQASSSSRGRRSRPTSPSAGHADCARARWGV